MELEIIRVMKQTAGTRFTCKEISKLVDRKAFRENHSWARPALEKLAAEGQIWKEQAFYLFPTEDQKAEQRHLRRS